MKTSYSVCQLVRCMLKPPLLITGCLAQLNRYFEVNIEAGMFFSSEKITMPRHEKERGLKSRDL